jgi:D-serine deaminase-like pyridoxal phosphate-dependent protein
MYQQVASSSAWDSAGSGEWAISVGTAYKDATSSSSGLRLSSRGATLTQQMSELNIRVGDMEEIVHQHIEFTQDWQQMSGERLHAIELAQQKQL